MLEDFLSDIFIEKHMCELGMEVNSFVTFPFRPKLILTYGLPIQSNFPFEISQYITNSLIVNNCTLCYPASEEKTKTTDNLVTVNISDIKTSVTSILKVAYYTTCKNFLTC